jgi:hypothetical protein
VAVVRNILANVSAGVDRDLTGKLIDMTFSFSFLLLGVQSKEEQTNWNISAPLHSVLVEISHLADERLTPESKRAGDLSSVSSFLFCPGLTHQLVASR